MRGGKEAEKPSSKVRGEEGKAGEGGREGSDGTYVHIHI